MKTIEVSGFVSEMAQVSYYSLTSKIAVTGLIEEGSYDFLCEIPTDIVRWIRLGDNVTIIGRVKQELLRNRSSRKLENLGKDGRIVPTHVLEVKFVLGDEIKKCVIGRVGKIEGTVADNIKVKNEKIFTIECESASDTLMDWGINKGTCLLCEAPEDMADSLKIGDKIIANGVKELNGKFVIEDIDAGIPFQETVSIYSEDTTCKTVHLDMKRLDHFIDNWNRSGGERLSESEQNELAANIVEFAERLFRNIYIEEHDRINHAIEKLEAADKLIRRSTIPVRTFRYLSREIDRFHVSLAKHVLKYDSESCANNGIGESASSIFWQYYSLYLMAAGLKRIKNVTFSGTLFDEKMPLLNLTIKGAVVNVPILAELFNYCSQLTSGGPFMEPWPELLKEYRERHC